MLRFKSNLKNVVLYKLKSKYNLIFLKYKLFFIYLNVPFKILINISNILIFPIFKRKIKAYFKRLREYL
jgi:hypothetical protein